MKYARKLTFVSILLLAFFFDICFAAEAEKVSCTGKIINSKGEPLESVKVGFYKVLVTSEETSYQATLDKEVQTDKEGKFEYTAEKDISNNTQVTIIYAQKEGFGLGWADWEVQRSGNVEIQLQPAAPVAGIVVDESDKPVADANVCLAFLMVKKGDRPQIALGEIMPDKLTTKTDEQGKFVFDNIPENAQFDFSVKKPGRATTITMDMEKFQNSQTLGFSAGQTDIKIVQPLEASIEGIVIEKNTGKPVSGARIVLGQGSQLSILYGFQPIVSAEDGTFSINGLPAKKFTLTYVAPDDKTSEWVSKQVEVKTQIGQTTSGVKIELSKGGFLEVIVKNAQNNQPIEQVSVHIQPQEGNKLESSRTNKEGIAQFCLAPGSYRIVQIYKQNYKHTMLEEIVEIEDEKTNHVELSLESYGKISGMILDENDKPVANAIVFVNPPIASETKTDANGKFELLEHSSGFADEGIPYLIVRDIEHNLAASYELYDKKEYIEIKLSEGVILSGRVVDSNDNVIQEPKISVIFRTSNIGVVKEEKDVVYKDGNFIIQALPEEVGYSIDAQADGYGRESTTIQTSLEPGEIFELEPIVLKLANMSVSGIVVDVDGKPVADARVYSSGSGQSNQRAQTDDKGRFTLDGVCAGRVDITAQLEQQEERPIYGYLQVEAGAKDVQIVISESGSSRTVQPRPVSLKGKTLPDISSLLAEFKPEMIKDKSVLVCFWDYEQRPSRNCIIQLNKKIQELSDKDVAVIAIQASKIEQKYLDEWLNEYSVNFPVGMIETGEEKTRINWGVKALPWLILTNKEHIVTDEGFSINELYEK